MAHILLDSKELVKFRQLNLPDGTTLIEKNSKGDALTAFEVKSGKWIITKDFVEYQRGWKDSDERLDFEKSLTKDIVVDYFLDPDHDGKVPQREYSVMSNYLFNNFKNIRPAGIYDGPQRYGTFKVLIHKSDNLEEVKEELIWLYSKFVKTFPLLFDIYLGIFEHTLSAGGIYSLIYERNKANFKMLKTSYGHDRIEKEFSNLSDAINYIQQVHYYE